LQEISIISNAMYSRKEDLARAGQLISRSDVAFEQFKENRGPYGMHLDGMVKSDNFIKIQLLKQHLRNYSATKTS
jgi:hypothetical protein